jgi:uncharacterized protein (TIRG00374 family)
VKKKLLKAALSLALMGFLFSRTNIHEIAQSTRSISLKALALFLVLNIVMVAINSYRWRVLLESQGITVPLGRLFNYYLIGIFFNNFMPGSVGGDIYRVVGVEDYSREKEKVLASVLMERMLGLIVLLPVSLVAFGLLLPGVLDQRRIIYSEAVMALFMVVVLPFFKLDFIRVFSFVYEPFFRLFQKYELKERARRVYSGLVGFLASKGDIAFAFFLSLLSRIVWIYACFILSRSMGHDLPVAVYFMLLPIIEFVRMFPVSINGLGVREGAFVLYFGAFGLKVPDALVLSLLVYTAFLVIGAVGGIIYGTSGWSIKKV